jgi:hypothetical protein
VAGIADRLAALEHIAAARGIDCSTGFAAIERRILAIEKRLHERAGAGAEKV